MNFELKLNIQGNGERKRKMHVGISGVATIITNLIFFAYSNELCKFSKLSLH